MSVTISPGVVRSTLDGLRDMYDNCLTDPELISANIHVQLAFTIASIRSEYASALLKN
ncbi:MAG: hypothetical protein ACXQS8_02180 [Candidatus Helarchaeales archaeon]